MAYGSDRSAWSQGRRPPGAVLQLWRELGELSQWLWVHHDDTDSSIKTALCIIVCPMQSHRTQYKITFGVCLVCQCVNVRSREFLEPNISKTIIDGGSIPMDYQQEIAYGESSGHVITWSWKVKVVTPQYVWGPLSRKRLGTQTRLQRANCT